MSTRSKQRPVKRRAKARSLVREPVAKYGSSTLLSKQHLPTKKMIEQISKGLAYGELEHLRHEIDEPMDSLARQLSISRSTLQRRKAERRLSPEESDRVMRFWKMIRYAVKLFGNIERARAWLKDPQFGLGGAIPLEFAKTEVGAREVEDLLGRIDYGVYS
jgi:putative toxin-antitoxin system antitoxin component (TIGR02293 family)